MANGVVLWEGKSRIDGNPIALILTYTSENRGTGDIPQTWILRRDVPPIVAIATGEDVSICGPCPLRGIAGKGRSCYVNPAHGPGAIFGAYQRGVYPRYDGSQAPLIRYHARMKPIRFGSYGDPCAVPTRVWRSLLELRGKGHTGYTHQWRERRNQPYASFLMASCETEQDATEARSRGWRAFRVRAPGSPLMRGEIECPKSHAFPELDRLDCAHCKACDGADRPGKVSVSIWLHGSRPIVGNGLRMLAALS